MATSVVHPDRIRRLDDARPPRDGDHVLYWMQHAQRAEHNDALEHAVRRANELGRPLLVAVALVPDYPDARRRHGRFLLQGLTGTLAALRRRSMGTVVRWGDPVEVVAELAGDAAEVVVDSAHLAHLRRWRQELVDAVDVPVWEVEADVVVPVDVASTRAEYAARTIRPKLLDHLGSYVEDLRTRPLDHAWSGPPPDGVELTDDTLSAVLDDWGLPGDDDEDVAVALEGGTTQARAHLRRFLGEGLAGYAERDPDPVADLASHLSPYLHFGHVSPVAVAARVRASDHDPADVDAFLEELVVRRELAVNHVVRDPDHGTWRSLPSWARETLDQHRDDPREHVYTATELEQAATHDEAWNACMREMRATGYLHNHLRMYWAKQVLSWTNTPEHAFRVLRELNDRWFLDGRDANSVANVAWTFGLHDRAFAERDVTGKLRPMTRSGLERKIDVDAWIAHVDRHR